MNDFLQILIFLIVVFILKKVRKKQIEIGRDYSNNPEYPENLEKKKKSSMDRIKSHEAKIKKKKKKKRELKIEEPPIDQVNKAQSMLEDSLASLENEVMDMGVEAKERGPVMDYKVEEKKNYGESQLEGFDPRTAFLFKELMDKPLALRKNRF